MIPARMGAALLGLAAAGILGAVGYFWWLPRIILRRAIERIVEAGEYNRRMAGILERPKEGRPPFVLKPHLDRGLFLRTDSLGLRSRELDAEKKHPRVLFLGDSFTFGYGVAEGEPFPAVVQSRLEGKAEVSDAGVSGFEIADMEAQFERLAPSVKPDVVVVSFVANDLDDSRVLDAEGYVRTPFLSELPDGFFASMTNMERLAAVAGLEGEEFAGFLTRHRGCELSIPLGIGPFALSRWELYKLHLGRIRDAARASGAVVLVFSFDRVDVPMHGLLLAACDSLGIPLFTMEPTFDSPSAENRLSWDPHPSPLAHRRFAERLLGAIASTGRIAGIGVAPIAPLRSTPELEKRWLDQRYEFARSAFASKVAFDPPGETANLQQILAGFEHPSGLLGARAILLLRAPEPVRAIRISATTEAPEERLLEVRLGGIAEPQVVRVGPGGLDTEIKVPLDAMIPILEDKSILVEVDLRDPVVEAAPPEMRRPSLAVRLRRLELR